MIKLMKSTFYHEKETKKALVDFIMKAEILSMGEECKKYESKFEKKQERKHAIFVSSGSAANLILLQALLNLGRLNKGDKVGFSSVTWATNVMPIIQLGLTPVAIDVNLETLNVSPLELKKYIKDLNALFLTNVLGFSDDIATIESMCSEANVIMLEDNCESLGSKVNGKFLGNFSLASTFSSFVGHHLSTIEGGVVCTDDDELAYMLMMVRAHGWDRNLPETKQKQLRSEHSIDDFYAKYTFYDLAYNTRPTEINGFIGNIQIEYWDEIVSKHQANFEKFQTAMRTNSKFVQYKLDHMEIVSNMAMPIVCRDSKDFEKLKDNFVNVDVEIRPLIAGDIGHQPFYKKYVKTIYHCPNSTLIHNNGLYFANNPELTEEELEILCDVLINI